MGILPHIRKHDEHLFLPNLLVVKKTANRLYKLQKLPSSNNDKCNNQQNDIDEWDVVDIIYLYHTIPSNYIGYITFGFALSHMTTVYEHAEGTT
ncbi:hypothetical protein JCM10914A_02440 [Paenibacillus sp. JCM 10914]